MKRDAYQALLLLLLPAVGCDGGKDTSTVEGSSGTACLQIGAQEATCPTYTTVAPSDLISTSCGAEILSVDGAGSEGYDPTGWGDTGGEWCCYPVTEQNDSECAYGRPFIQNGRPQWADTEGRGGWTAGMRPSLVGLPAEARSQLAAAWRQAALEEHASVAAFARLTLELMALGAPAALVAQTTTAATEEVHHATIAFQLASAYAGCAVGPSGFPLGSSVPLTENLAAFAAATVREGCIGETLTTLVALSCLAQATDPAACAALRQITEDEQGHARLAWATVRWALDVGGPPVRAAVAAAFAALDSEAFPLPVRLADGPHRALLVAHGVPDARMARAAIRRGVAEVVLPAARELLAAAPVARRDVAARL